MGWALYLGIGVCVIPFVRPDDGWSFGSVVALLGALARLTS